MATTKLYLDTRCVKAGTPAPLKLAVTKDGKTSMIHFNVKLLPSQWDRQSGKVSGHPDKRFLNSYISNKKQAIDNILLKLSESGELAGMTATEIRSRIAYELSPEKDSRTLFEGRFLAFANSKKASTRGIYMHTYRRMKDYAPGTFGSLTFEDITKEWLTGFDTFMQRTSPSKNARNIHLRNIRAVFNEALDDGVTKAYPFRRFKIRPVATPKRSLTVEQLRNLFSFPVEKHVQKYLDMFKLIFFLIGINAVDLCRLKEIRFGRIEYYRAKTNRLYSIRVEPEALEIIDRYRGRNYLIDVLDRYRDHKDYVKRLNENLQRIGKVERHGLGGKKYFAPMFPNVTTYWARHSWATVAASLDIPKETIAAALGHGGNTVTDIYIDFDRRKVDDANRRVLDWVLYGKR